MLSTKVKNQKGISLLFIVLMVSFLLAVALGISAILIQATEMMREIGHSVVSFYAADSGIEKRLHDLYKSRPPYEETYGDSCGQASFETIIKCGASVAPEACPDNLAVASSDEECDALNFCLKSVGSYKEVKRAIEIKY